MPSTYSNIPEKKFAVPTASSDDSLGSRRRQRRKGNGACPCLQTAENMQALPTQCIEKFDSRVLSTSVGSAIFRKIKKAHAATIMRPSRLVGLHSRVFMRLLSIAFSTT